LPEGKDIDRRENADQPVDKEMGLHVQTVIEEFVVLEPAAITYRQIVGERLVKPFLRV